MFHKNFYSKVLIAMILALTFPLPVLASQYACTIKAVLKLNDTGQYVAHGWVANYMNRKFFLDRDTGKVIGTTALKARLTNFDKTHSPTVLINPDEETSYKAVTVFENKGQFSSLRIEENFPGTEKPYAYQTAVGMHITGTCSEATVEN